MRVLAITLLSILPSLLSTSAYASWKEGRALFSSSSRIGSVNDLHLGKSWTCQVLGNAGAVYSQIVPLVGGARTQESFRFVLGDPMNPGSEGKVSLSLPDPEKFSDSTFVDGFSIYEKFEDTYLESGVMKFDHIGFNVSALSSNQTPEEFEYFSEALADLLNRACSQHRMEFRVDRRDPGHPRLVYEIGARYYKVHERCAVAVDEVTWLKKAPEALGDVSYKAMRYGVCSPK